MSSCCPCPSKLLNCSKMHSPRVIEVYPDPKLSSLNPELGWSEFILENPTAIHYAHKNSLTDFFVQDYAQHEKVREITESILKRMDKNSAIGGGLGGGLAVGPIVGNLDVGSFCLAPYGKRHFRAEVIEKNSNFDGFYRIFYIDFGSTNIVNQKYLRKIPIDLVRIPRQVSHMRWDVAVAKLVDESDLNYLAPKSIVAKKMIAPGQYLASFGNHPIFDDEVQLRLDDIGNRNSFD